MECFDFWNCSVLFLCNKKKIAEKKTVYNSDTSSKIEPRGNVILNSGNNRGYEFEE